MNKVIGLEFYYSLPTTDDYFLLPISAGLVALQSALHICKLLLLLIETSAF